MSDDLPKKMVRDAYRHHPPCPECGERAIRRDRTSDAGRYQCDSCGTAPELEIDPLEFDHESVDDDELFDPDIDELDDILSADDVGIGGGTGRELTDAEKSKKNLANACYAVGALFCLTIVGIPIGLLFLVLGAVVSPDLNDDNDDN